MSIYKKFLRYMFELSDSFSIIIDLCKMTEDNYRNIVEHLESHLIQKRSIKKNIFICFYTCNIDTKKIILENSSSVYCWDGRNQPEDLYFYKKNKYIEKNIYSDPNGWGSIRKFKGISPWCYSLAHEEKIWLLGITEEDLYSIKSLNVEIRPYRYNFSEYKILWHYDKIKLRPQYEKFIDYAFKTSDYFSLLVLLPMVEEDRSKLVVKQYMDIVDRLQPYLIESNRLKENERFITSAVSGTDIAVNYYVCNEETKKILLEGRSCVYDWDGWSLPGDLHFYRDRHITLHTMLKWPEGCPQDETVYQGREPWFCSSGHYEFSIMNDITDDDLRFFQEANIEIKQYDKEPSQWDIYWDGIEKSEDDDWE